MIDDLRARHDAAEARLYAASAALEATYHTPDTGHHFGLLPTDATAAAKAEVHAALIEVSDAFYDLSRAESDLHSFQTPEDDDAPDGFDTKRNDALCDTPERLDTM